MTQTAKTPRRRVSAKLLLPAFVLACVFLSAVQPYRSYDVWHHIRCGWYAMPTNHGPATTEPFTFVGRDLRLPWIQYEWLAQIFIYLAHTRLGVNGAILAKAAVFTLAFGALALACLRRGAGPEATALALIATTLACAPRFWLRPGAFSFLIFGALLWLIECARDGSLMSLWLLPPMFALWANLHGAYVAGWVLVAMSAASAWTPVVGRRLRFPPWSDGPFLHWLRQPGRPRRAAVTLTLVLVACVLAVCANPYGFRILKVPLELSRNAMVRQCVNEWKRPTMDSFLCLGGLFIPLLAVGLVIGRRRVRLLDALTIVAFGYLATRARRHISLFAFIAAPIVAECWAPAFHRLRRMAWATRAALALAAFAAILATLGLERTPGAALGCSLRHFGLGIDKAKYPIQCADYIISQNLTGNFCNDYADGNYFIWRLNEQWNDDYPAWNAAPPRLMFVDGRIDVYGTRVMNLYTRVMGARKGWREVLDRFNVNVAVAIWQTSYRPRRGEKVKPHFDALWNDPEWSLVFWSDTRAVFVRGAQLKGLTPFSVRPDTFAASAFRDERSWRDAVAEMRRRVDMGPEYDCATARAFLADLLMARGKLGEAVAHLKRACELEPFAARHAYNLGACLLRSGQARRAIGWFRRALLLKPERPAMVWNALGSCHISAGRPREAVRCIEKAIALDPGRALSRLNLSVAYEKLNRPDLAVKAVERALKIAPDNAAARGRLQQLKRKHLTPKR